MPCRYFKVCFPYNDVIQIIIKTNWLDILRKVHFIIFTILKGIDSSDYVRHCRQLYDDSGIIKTRMPKTQVETILKSLADKKLPQNQPFGLHC